MRTPRDTFALNQEDGVAGGATPRDVKMREIAMRDQLRSGLAALPKAQEIQFALPEQQEEAAGAGDGLEEDAAERDRRERERQAAIDELERRRRTQVVQKQLPRPVAVDLAAMVKRAKAIENDAERLIALETAALMANDAAKYPLPGAQPRKPSAALPLIDDSALADARLLILAETAKLPALDHIQTMFESRAADSTRLGLGCYGEVDADAETAIMRIAFDAAQESLMAAAEKGSKIESKLSLHLGGYQKRQKMLKDKIGEAADALDKARVALSGFGTLSVSEDAAIDRRLGALRDEVAFVSRREREAQENYRLAKTELDGLLASANVNGVH